MQSINSHGDLIKDALEDQQVQTGTEQQQVDAKQQADERDLVTAMQAITSALTSGHDKLSSAVSSGNDKISSAVTSGHEKVALSLTTGQEKISSAVQAATNSINLVAGAVKVCIPDCCSLNLVSKDAGDENKASLDNIASSVNTGDQKVSQT